MLLFTSRNGTRTPIQRRSNGLNTEFVVGAEGDIRNCRKPSCWRKSATTPEDFSPNVLLRPTVGTICCLPSRTRAEPLRLLISARRELVLMKRCWAE